MAIADISKVYPIVHKALDYRSIRQDMIASNLANVDTPLYRPKDVNFEQYLSRENKKIFGGAPRSYKLELAKTSSKHLDTRRIDKDTATMFWRDGHLAKNDGNSVDLDVETSEMGKNSTMYQALTSALKRHKGIFAYAMDSGRNI
ncbi:flagellar basal body rod protein FlgB [Helicobacter sp. MIT 21-1697]|uniref:flagellar basal body rod protein FlgB n=1 Tax=Helicobacter sp. MIT 21-1697 TaxID=2993733 RepID=UPI00224A6D75|nr:flagellar basal body rod protein FlgB [Helicobacter sp. MIT 21-1697]MCX2717413.1 flagellar basal body rod protein FlgB [Helicobacter sp. MIT 21-1697]